MKPFYFGNAERQLYGVYHSPGPSGGRHAVLLCNPGAQEYNATHWAFRRLAATLCRNGMHVLRFDYYGTGDSAGKGHDALPSDWIRDMADAAQELRDLSDARELSVVGLRLGAALATMATCAGLRAHKLVLWEPVIHGADYIKELEYWDAKRNVQLLHTWETRSRRYELLGHAFSPELRRAIEQIDISVLKPESREVIVCGSALSEAYGQLRDSMAHAGVAVDLKLLGTETGQANSGPREHSLVSNDAITGLAKILQTSERG